MCLCLCEGGDEKCRGTVLADSDNDSGTDDNDDDNDNDDDDVDRSEDSSRALMIRRWRQYQSRSPKHHGTVRVLWSGSDSDPSWMRVGRDGCVDVWCLDKAPGGQYYRDHLGVLDSSLVFTGDRDEEDDDGDEVWVPTPAGVGDTIRTRTALGMMSIQNCPLPKWPPFYQLKTSLTHCTY